MSENEENQVSRRRFLKVAAGTAAAAVAVGALPRLAHAGGLPHLKESDPAAQALHYHEDASKVSAAKYPQYKKGDICAICRFYQGKPGDTWGPCQLFPGKDVHKNGWCEGFSKK